MADDDFFADDGGLYEGYADAYKELAADAAGRGLRVEGKSPPDVVVYKGDKVVANIVYHPPRDEGGWDFQQANISDGGAILDQIAYDAEHPKPAQ